MYIATRNSTEVIGLTSSLDEEYERYVSEHEAGLLYYSSAYRRLLEGTVRGESCYLVARRHGRICGVMPVFRQAGPYGTVVNALPYFGSHGAPIADDAAAETALLQAFGELASSSDVASATVIGNPMSPPRTRPTFDVVDERIGQLTPIDFADDHGERLMEAYHSKTRNMIRKAEKEGVLVERDDDAFEFLLEVHRENMAAKGGLPKENAFFERLASCFSAGSGYRIYTASIDGERVAALLLLYYNGVVEYFTPVIRVEHRSSQPLSLIIFEAMADAAQRGYRLWNWGGTWPSQESLHRFKKRWGTVDRPYTYYVRVNNPTLREATPDELLAAYPDAYVLPFSQLNMSRAA